MAMSGPESISQVLPDGINNADELRDALRTECEILDRFLGILEDRINTEASPAVKSWLGTWKNNLTTDREVADGYLTDLDAGGSSTDTVDAEIIMVSGLLSVALIYQRVSAGANDPRLDALIQAWVADLQDSTDALTTIRRILAL